MRIWANADAWCVHLVVLGCLGVSTIRTSVYLRLHEQRESVGALATQDLPPSSKAAHVDNMFEVCLRPPPQSSDTQWGFGGSKARLRKSQPCTSRARQLQAPRRKPHKSPTRNTHQGNLIPPCFCSQQSGPLALLVPRRKRLSDVFNQGYDSDAPPFQSKNTCHISLKERISASSITSSPKMKVLDLVSVV